IMGNQGMEYRPPNGAADLQECLWLAIIIMGIENGIWSLGFVSDFVRQVAWRIRISDFKNKGVKMGKQFLFALVIAGLCFGQGEKFSLTIFIKSRKTKLVNPGLAPSQDSVL
ncbi:MAG: hypothetical protein ACPL28_12400, partial [bacterium]